MPWLHGAPGGRKAAGGSSRCNRQPGKGVIPVGLEDHLPAGFLLTTVEKWAQYTRSRSMWPATFGLACCAIEMMQTAGPRHDFAQFGMEKMGNTPREADLMIIAGRVCQKMAPVLRQIYDQMPDPKWVIAMGVCASSGGMFNNYAIVQGADHIVPVDIYLPGCPPRPEMLLDAISSSCATRSAIPGSASTATARSPSSSTTRCDGHRCTIPARHDPGISAAAVTRTNSAGAAMAACSALSRAVRLRARSRAPGCRARGRMPPRRRYRPFPGTIWIGDEYG